MLKGLVIGKFMPFHKGHISLIDFALENCDELTVAVCSLKSEPINGALRFMWVQEHYKYNPKVNVIHITQELPDSSESDKTISFIWTRYLKKILPETNVIFASEKYAQYIAEFWGIEYKLYDCERRNVSISATMIRKNPYKYFRYLADEAKPYYTKTICIYGSESCGKTTLTKMLAKEFNTCYVPEMARAIGEFGNVNWNNVSDDMFVAFAKSQHDTIITMKPLANKVLFVDSDNLTTQIYARTYNVMSSERIRVYDKIDYDLYLLLKPDCPFVQDGTRKYANTRNLMHKLFKDYLIQNHRPYLEIGGSWEERFIKSKTIVNSIIGGLI